MDDSSATASEGGNVGIGMKSGIGESECLRRRCGCGLGHGARQVNYRFRPVEEVGRIQVKGCFENMLVGDEAEIQFLVGMGNQRLASESARKRQRDAVAR